MTCSERSHLVGWGRRFPLGAVSDDYTLDGEGGGLGCVYLLFAQVERQLR